MEIAAGKADEVTMTYTGKRPLTFAAHLEKIEFERDTGKIKNLVPLIKVVKLVEIKNRVFWNEASA
jgi:hypothetical protein